MRVVFILGIFCMTVDVARARSLTPQVTTEVIVETVSKHSGLFNIVAKGKPVELLAEIFRGADVNVIEDSKTLVQHARELGRDDMVEILIRHGAEDNELLVPEQMSKDGHMFTRHGHKPPTLVVESIEPEPVSVQLVDNSDLQQKCGNPLHLAVQAGHTDKAKGLIAAASEDLNAKDELGRTVAHHAAMTGNLEVITALADNDANLSIKDNFGSTPYAEAKLAGHADIVAYLAPMMDVATVQEADFAEGRAAALALRAQNKTCTNRPL